MFPGIATRTYLLPNVPHVGNILGSYRLMIVQLETCGQACYRPPVVRGRKNPGHLRFASRLRKAIQHASHSQTAPAARSTLAGWAQGQRLPRIDAVEQVSYALGLSPAFLGFGLAFEPTPPIDKLRSLGVAARLRDARQARGLSVRVLATAAGVSHTAVGNVEQGTMPGLDTAEALAIALGVSPAWLAYGLGPMELPKRRRAAVVTQEPDHG